MSPRHLKVLLAAAAAVVSASACRTTAGHEASQAEKPQGASLTATLEPTKDEEQALYLQMLDVELQNGIKVPKEQLHSSKGVFECRTDVAPATCQLRVRLGGETLAASQPVPAPLAAKIWAFVQGSRPELAKEKAVLVDASCNYVGKASPPYTVEDVRCTAELARAPDEAVFDGRLAEELGEDLRGDQPYGNGTVTLMGSLACQWLPSSPRTPCVARALVGGVLQEKVTEVSTGGSAEAARRLRRALFDHAQITGVPTPPGVTAISAALVCVVDNSKVESDGRRTYVCRAKL